MPLDGVLHKAALKGDLGVIEEYLSQYPNDVNAKGAQQRTPLHRAVGGGSDKKSIVLLLLDYKADPNAPDINGLTPLHWAATLGNTDFGTILLDHGANPNVQTKNGDTALHFCAEKGNSTFIQLLLNHNADPTLRNNDTTNKRGHTPYDVARKFHNKECARLLKLPGTSRLRFLICY
uniref:Ankyrin-3 n=1 Tax=Lygus hesperus TaxID=30085 RepID=A0A0A9VX16_LYGHE